jgi:DNA-binding NarL/FixJ family response regulator
MNANSMQPIILAVDDAPDTLSLLTDILEGAGMTALVARSGKSALQLMERIQPDLILMDAMMPDMDGFETCRRIKQTSQFAHIPLIFMTGLSDTEHVVRGFKAGGIDYVTKPVIPDELLVRIMGHLTNARLAQSARAALDISGTPLVAVDGHAEVLWMTPESQRLLGKSPFGADTNSSAWRGEVTPALARILEHRLAKANVCTTQSGPLTASFAGESRPGEYLIRLSIDTPVGDAEVLRKRLDLTGREAEVLLWIAQGKSNRDVAEILACSPRTVNKHLEQVYGKLQVENRTAAAMLALRILMDA